MIADYLDGGGVIVFGGHLHHDWLRKIGLRESLR
jgi:hypothetical protein